MTERRPSGPVRFVTTAFLAAAVLSLALAPETHAGDASSDGRFLAGLRERHLFELAEGYCTRRIEDPQLSDALRADLATELSLTLADWAVNSPPDQREPLWQRALAVTDDFARQHPESPRLLLVRLQGALVLLTRGELAGEEARLVAQAEPLLDEAKASLASAIRSLQTLAGEVEQALRDRSTPGRSEVGRDRPAELAAHELAALRDNIRYQLARAYRNQAECYAAGSPDRADSLTQAVETLDPLAKLDTSHPLGWKARIDEIVCRRLLADYPAAQRELESLLAANPPPEVALRARAEQLRLALATNRLSDAVQMLSGGRRIDGRASGELDYAFLETCLAAWRASNESGRDQEAGQWQSKANEMVALIRREDGPYWTRRAQMLLSGYVRDLPGGDVEMWVQAAENAYHGGQYDDALAAYDRARRLARQQGDAAQAFQLGFQAATIEHQRGRHAQAMVRYRELALSLPDQPKAPEAHLLALWHAGQIAAQKPGGSLEEYIALAEEHLATWPGASTADGVRWRLGRARELRGEWEKAVEQYRAISPGYPGFAEVVEAADRAYGAWLDQARAAGEPTEAIASAAAEWFQSLVVGPQGRMPERWSPAAQKAAVSAARLWLNYTTTGFDRAERILSAALDGARDATPEWQSNARALLVFSLAAQGRRHEATKVLEQISAGSAEQLLKMLQGLARVGATSERRTKGELAELELGVVELLRAQREELNPASQRALDLVAAQALADSGQTAAALGAYRRLSQEHPEDGEIQEGYAQLLLARPDAADTEAALAKWREVEKKTPQGTDRWFRAKLALALLHDRSGSPQQAEKILRLLQILYPQPKLRDREVTARFADSLDPAMKAQLFELLGRYER